MKSRDQEYYFFSALDKKYGNGARMNRATNMGYWKATGNDRPVKHNNKTVGMKKTLVFHSGRAPDGKRTNWVMHEYRLVDTEMERPGNGVPQVRHWPNFGDCVYVVWFIRTPSQEMREMLFLYSCACCL